MELDDFEKKVIKISVLVVLSLIALCLTIGSISAYYQSKITGYSFWTCFWAGDTVKTINLKK